MAFSKCIKASAVKFYSRFLSRKTEFTILTMTHQSKFKLPTEADNIKTVCRLCMGL